MTMTKEDLFIGLRKRYAESRRAYHTQAHIDAMLRWMDELKSQIVDAEVFEWAIWYHDAVYEPMRSDNEEKSADLARLELTSIGLSETKINAVFELIAATKTHIVFGKNPDCALFLDVDMSILGTPPDVYKHYVQLIRKEYKWVPSLLFKKNRGAMLKNWLTRDVIFYTPVMRSQLEAQARINLQNEVDSF